MIVGSGIDIIEVDRIQAVTDKWQGKFLQKVFTPKELEYAQNKKNAAEHLAARFAIKEALVKAFSENGQKHLGNWKDIEVQNDKSGRPFINLYGNFSRIKEERKLKDIIISASHTHKYAVASVLLTK